MWRHLKTCFQEHHHRVLFRGPGWDRTYGEVWNAAGVKAGVWKHRYGEVLNDPRSRVYLIRDNGVTWMEEFLAAMRMDKSVVILSPKMPPRVLQEKIRQDGGGGIVCADSPLLEPVVRDGISKTGSGTGTGNGDEPTITLVTSGSSSGVNRQNVELGTSQILTNIRQIHERVDLQMIHPNDTSFSLLPWSHCYGLTCELLCLTGRGASLYLPSRDGSMTIRQQLRTAQPTLLFAVPFLLEKILQQLGPLSRFVKKGIAASIINRMVMGGKLRSVSVGGASMSGENLTHFENALGVDVYEGYGMTEASPMISLNTRQDYRRGSVGKPLPGVEVYIDPSTDEILVHGENIARHLDKDRYLYLNKDRWYYKTGDRGRIDQDGFLYVVDRLKDHFKLANGLFVYPQRVEQVYHKYRPLAIQQWVVFQDPRPLHSNELVMMGILETGTPHATHHTVTKDLVEIGQNEGLSSYEIPQTVWYTTVEEIKDMLTEKQTPRRSMLREYFASLMDHKG